MIGTISSYDAQKRCGYIKESSKNTSLYFSKISVIDESLKIEVGKKVTFKLYGASDEKEAVAVKIASCDPLNDKVLSADVSFNEHRNGDGTRLTDVPSEEHKNGYVIFYKDDRKFGFIKCEGVQRDVFFHQHELFKCGINSVQRGQRLKLCIDRSEGNDRLKAKDIILVKTPTAENEKYGNSGQYLSKRFTSDAGTTKPHTGKHDISPCAIPHERFPSKPIGFVPVTDKRPDASNYQHMYQSFPKTSVKEQLYKGIISHPLHSISQRTNNMAVQRVPVALEAKPENPSRENLRQQISQKQKLLHSFDLSKLPDGGRRLHDQITELQLKLKNMHLQKDEDQVIEKGASKSNSQEKSQHANEVSDLHGCLKQDYDISLYGQNNDSIAKERDITTKETKSAIESLHSALDACPSSSSELEDPEGLLVTLMTHQRQALEWLVWREKQSISGGILADDMGLGKTLTMISLILKQMETVDDCKSNDKEKITDIAAKKEELNEEDSSKEAENKLGANEEDTGEVKASTNTDEKEIIDKKEAGISGPEFLVNSESTLVIAPASLIYHWNSEIRNRCRKGLLSIHLFHGSSREKNPEKLAEFDVVITTYDIVRKTKPVEEEKLKERSPKVTEATLFQIKWRRIVLDEAHNIRNYKNQTSEATCSLKAQSRWALSGTPVQNQQNDMYAMIKFLHCHPFDNYKIWKSQVSNNTERGRKRLKTLVSTFVLRREKNQKGVDGKPLVALPQRTFTIHKLTLNSVEQEVYNKLKLESRSAYQAYEAVRHQKSPDAVFSAYSEYNHLKYEPKKKMSATALLVKLLRLRQCCGHLSLLGESFDQDLLSKEKDEMAVEDLFRSMTLYDETSFCKSLKMENYVQKDKSQHFETTASSSKIKFVMDTLNTLKFERPDDKCVIISQWTSMLRVVIHQLNEAKISYGVIDGSVTARKRMDIVDDFNRNPLRPKVILVSLQAGGVGLNLIGGNHLFLLDMHWNPALEKQAFDRIYRVGQKKEVFVHKFMVEGTVEENILELQERKLAMAKAVMEGADTKNKVRLTLDDMKMLFGI